MKSSKKQKSRFVFLRLKVVKGEYEYNCISGHATQCTNINFFAERYAAGFYMDKETCRQGNAWYSHFGCVATSVELVKEISQEHYFLLQQYLQ